MQIRILAILAAAVAALPALATDDCTAPTPIAGSVVAPFDLTQGQLDAPGVGMCANNPVPFTSDFWFCWTSDVDGMVSISTCGLTTLDTGVAIYPETLGCACPGDLHPLCCNDDANGNCGKQSAVTCEVRCGQRYMIQVAARADGTAPIGQVRIETNGNPCDGGGQQPIVCAPCCGTRPPIVDSSSVGFNWGAVAAGTYAPFGGTPCVTLFDLGNQGAAPIGMPSWNTGRYSHPSWTPSNLGTVFGVVIDDVGDVVVTHSTVYNFDLVGALGGAGSVYRLNGTTGAAGELIRLPNAVTAADPFGAGLGQVDFSCQHSLYYVSNFEDGRIYAIDQAGAIKSTFDHASGTVTGALTGSAIPEPGDQPGGVGYGERVWAVKVVDGRLVYSLWVEDASFTDAARNNEIWSVKLDANGLFVANSTQLELSMPSANGSTLPVADIAFDSNCCMFTAERGMDGFDSTIPHIGRLLKFCSGADGWTPASETFSIGFAGSLNSVGGVDIEGLPNDRVWSIGDAINVGAPNVYGLIGFPSAGGDRDNSLLVDFDGDFNSQLKTQYGSIDLSCVEQRPCEFSTLDIDCKPNADGTVGFLWTVQITNNSATAANLLVLGSPIFAPNNVIVLNPPLAPGASMVVNVPIPVGIPGDQVCFFATLAASAKNECCSEEICIVLPDCSCFDYDANVQDIPGAGNFDVTLNMTNFTNVSNAPGFVGEWVSVAVAPGYTATVTPTLINIPSLPLFATMNVGPITVQTTQPAGSTIILIIGLHSASFHPCCFVEVPVTVPTQQGSSTQGDANADGTVNAADLSMLLSNWGNAGATDFNGSGATDGADMAILLSNWS
ncbi:MAG: hypothetical protein RLZZ217_1788 [Planctomycetota bacterium]